MLLHNRHLGYVAYTSSRSGSYWLVSPLIPPRGTTLNSRISHVLRRVFGHDSDFENVVIHAVILHIINGTLLKKDVLYVSEVSEHLRKPFTWIKNREEFADGVLYKELLERLTSEKLLITIVHLGKDEKQISTKPLLDTDVDEYFLSFKNRLKLEK
jgi:hypothetical protein